MNRRGKSVRKCGRGRRRSRTATKGGMTPSESNAASTNNADAALDRPVDAPTVPTGTGTGGTVEHRKSTDILGKKDSRPVVVHVPFTGTGDLISPESAYDNKGTITWKSVMTNKIGWNLNKDTLSHISIQSRMNELQFPTILQQYITQNDEYRHPEERDLTK